MVPTKNSSFGRILSTKLIRTKGFISHLLDLHKNNNGYMEFTASNRKHQTTKVHNFLLDQDQMVW